MKQILIYFLTIMFVSSCVSNPTQTEEGLTNLRFIDTDTFDQNLSKSMIANTKSITISVIGKVSINEIPNRLGKWLSVITTKDGQVDFIPIIPPQPIRTTGSIAVTAIIGLLPTAYDFFKDKLHYGAAANYDANLYYKSGSGLLEKVLFIKRN
ncbi:MAG: hypothetical protein KAG43_04840 [Candidatus Marithrix sp.]|nr:hypothetical protein [Candidatus Marithrix sp.]